MKYIKSLDGLRGFAILLVMLFHFEILGLGWIGVQMFFVLSGFLITQILIADKENIPDRGFLLKRFYWRRILRIFPVYFLYLFLLFCVSFFVHIPNLNNAFPFLLTYTYNFTPLFPNLNTLSEAWGHFWSLAVEEQFYLLWPFLIVIFPLKRLKYILIFLVLLTPFLRFVLGEILKQKGIEIGKAMYWITPAQIDSIGLGALLAVMYLNNEIKKINLIAIVAGTIVLFTAIFNYANYPCSIGTFGFTAQANTGWQHVYNYSVINMATAVLILILVNNKNSIFQNLFSNKYMVSIGKVSYGMYIFHEAVNIGFLYLMSDILDIHNKAIKFIFFLLYFVIVYLISKFSFSFFESYFLRMKEKRFVVKNQIKTN